MNAPTITSLTSEDTVRVLLALNALGYWISAERKVELAAALAAPGGYVGDCYDAGGHYVQFLVRPPVHDEYEHTGVSLYVSSGGYLAMLRPEAAKQFKRHPPEFTTDGLEMVFWHDGASFVFSTDCSVGYIATIIHWGIVDLNLAELTSTRFVAHDHGTLRDGPCYSCLAVGQGGTTLKCFVCNGTGQPVTAGHNDCWLCGGRCEVVRFVGELTDGDD